MPEQADTRPCSGRGPRRPYQPPELFAVDLQADEVLAVGCKMLTHSSAAGSTLNCVVSHCAQAGS